MKCPKCKENMEPGVIPGRNLPLWISKTSYEEMGLFSGPKIKKSLTQYCCEGCGFIETYAKDMNEE